MTLKKIQLSSAFLLLLACQGGEGDETGACDPGSLKCECVQGQLCLEGLECNAGVCVVAVETGDGDGDPGDGDGESGDGDGDGDGESGDGDGDSGDGDGDGGPGDGDGDPGCDPGLMNCSGSCVDLLSDNENCGSCGTVCKVVDEIGQCVQGECGNVWSDCHDANTDLVSCSELCQNDGLTCVPQGCGGLTMIWYGLLSSCEIVGSGSGSTAGCDQPMVVGDDYYRCCCAQ